jgi:large subunit ribosomal protein L35
MKTHSGSKKRFKKTKSGLVKYTQSGRRHLLTKKSRNRKRALRKNSYIKTCDLHHMRVLLPYS